MKNRERDENAPRSFRIRAENVPAQGIEINEQLSAGFVNHLLAEPNNAVSWVSLGDTPFSAHVEHEADMLVLKGGGTFNVLHPCVRCMEDVAFNLKINLHSRLLPQSEDERLEELEFDSETLEVDSDNVVSYYKDGIIDLSELLREQLFLEFPLYPSCDSPEAKDPKECDMSALERVNMPSATVIEHPFARLKDFKTKDA